MLKVGIVGTGFMAKTHAEAYQQLEQVQLVGFTATNELKGRQTAAALGGEYFTEYAAMLQRDDIDIIDICAPTHVHEQLVVQAAEAGKHIICEKPIALTLDAADRMLASVRKAGVHFMIAHVLRFWPEYNLIKQMVDDGQLGRIHTIYASRLAQYPNWNTWFSNAEQSGGALHDIHLHDIDYLYYLFGPVHSVHAIGKKTPNQAWNHVISQLTFTSGVQACVEGSAIMPDGFPFSTSLRAMGDKGTVDFSWTAGFNIDDVDSAQQSFRYYSIGEEPRDLHVEQHNAFVSQLKYFTDCVKADQPPAMNKPEQSRAVLKVMLAIHRSLETREIQYLME